MKKKLLDGITALIPLPAVMVSCQKPGERPNIITIAWTGIACSEPPMITIGIRKNRHSYNIIKETGEFVVNMTTAALAEATDICGNVSGTDTDKFALAGLTPEPSSKIFAPLIAESPINLECKTKTILELGSHDLFIAEIVATHIAEDIYNDQGRLDISKLDPLVYCTKAQQYWAGMSELVGKYGYAKKALGKRNQS